MNQPKKQTKTEVKGKESTKDKAKESTKVKAKESKTDMFYRIAKLRVQNVLKALRILGNCSNRSNYSYNEKEINKIYETLQNGLDTMISKFTPSKAEQESFDF